MNDIVIGDIHGSISALKQLLDRLPIHDFTHRLVFLGDYIDRGEDSKAVLDTLMAMEQHLPCTPIFLRGNHEDMCLSYIHNREMQAGLWEMNGGYKTASDFGGRIPTQYTDWLHRTRPYLETDTHIYVHAGLEEREDWRTIKGSGHLWHREPFLSSSYDWGKRVVFGHTIQYAGPLVQPNKIGIDTGAFLPDGYLTALLLPEMRFVSVNAAGKVLELVP